MGVLIIEEADKTQIKNYLLGRLQEQDEESVEIRLLSDPVYVEEFDVVVDELTDRYVAGAVQGAERDQMERYFFAAPARREKLRIAAALKERTQHTDSARRWLPSKELRAAASILIVFGLAFGVWWAIANSDSELDKGMAALQVAYQKQRPIEPRVSGLAHSDFAVRRGSETNGPMSDELRLAQLHLEQAVKDKPSPEARQELGKVYLAQGKVAEAIREFEAALQNRPNSAQLHNDLGVAWLEKKEFNRSLDSFNKALQLDGNSLEPVFNRALAYEKQSRNEEAKTGWQEYLKRDSSSPWATEARRHLQTLESM